MNIHEYQAKAVLKEFGVPVSNGRAVLRIEDAEAAAKDLGGPLWVVKSQIHAGGPPKGRFKEPEAGEKGGGDIAFAVLHRPMDRIRQGLDFVLAEFNRGGGVMRRVMTLHLHVEIELGQG